jgi:hypothetical protein
MAFEPVIKQLPSLKILTVALFFRLKETPEAKC